MKRKINTILVFASAFLFIFFFGFFIGMSEKPRKLALDFLEQDTFKSGATSDSDQCEVIRAVPYVIKNPGTYCFERDLTADEDGIRVEANFVTIDFKGFALRGQRRANRTSIGITGSEVSNVLIQNGTIHGFSAGVVLVAPRGSGYNELYRMKITESSQFGARLIGRHSRVTRSEFRWIGGGDAPSVVHTHGLYINGPGAVVRNNHFFEIRGNDLTKKSEGVALAFSGHINGGIIQDNTFENVSLYQNNWIAPSLSTFAVWIGGDGVGNVVVTGNTVRNFVNGIIPDVTVSAVVMSNVFYETVVPITLRNRPTARAQRNLAAGADGYRPSDRDGKRPIGFVTADYNRCEISEKLRDRIEQMPNISGIEKCIREKDLTFDETHLFFLTQTYDS